MVSHFPTLDFMGNFFRKFLYVFLCSPHFTFLTLLFLLLELFLFLLLHHFALWVSLVMNACNFLCMILYFTAKLLVEACCGFVKARPLLYVFFSPWWVLLVVYPFSRYLEMHVIHFWFFLISGLCCLFWYYNSLVLCSNFGYVWVLGIVVVLFGTSMGVLAFGPIWFLYRKWVGKKLTTGKAMLGVGIWDMASRV